MLAEQRAAARAAKDWSASDSLRDQIASLGWVVKDGPDGYELAPKPAYEACATLADLPAPPNPPVSRCGVALLVDGWPEDLSRCVDALVEFAPADTLIWLLDLGDVDGVGRLCHELAVAHPQRVIDLHCAQTLEQAGWAKATTRLIELQTAPLHAVMDISTVLTGDALTPLMDACQEPGVVGAGWRGVDVDTQDAWRSFVDASVGEADALLGYLMVVNVEAARATPPNPKARFYRNADMEWGLMLRAAGGRLVVPSGDLPVRQDRHHGYHDTDPQVRDRESKKNYDRLLQQFRGKDAVLHPRS